MNLLKLFINIIQLIFKKKVTSYTIVVKNANPNDVLVHEAQNWIGVKEDGDNSGPEVEMFQRTINAHPNKEAWCADFVIFCITQVEKKLAIKSEIYRSEVAQDLFFKSSPSLRLIEPCPGAVIIWRHGTTNLGHAGIIETVGKDGFLTTIEGNTGPGDGVVREGDGVYRRLRTKTGSSSMSVVGFIKPF